MKSAIRSIVPLVALAAAAKAAPFLAVGDSAELFLTGTAGVRADDNILLSSNKIDDIIYTITPGFDLVYGQGTETKGHVIYQEVMDQYGRHSKMDNELSKLSAEGTYDDKKTVIHFGTSWAQEAANSFDTRTPFATQAVKADLIRRDVFKIGADGEVAVTDKSTVGTGASYEKTDYKRVGYDDIQVTSIPVNYFYEISQKVDLGFGFRFRENNLDTGVDSKDYFYSFAARGEFTPKLTGKIAVGYTQRDFKVGTDRGAFGLESSLAYAFDEKTSVTAGVVNDFFVGATGAAERNTVSRLGFSSKIAADWTLGANVAWHRINYINLVKSQSDDFYEGTVSATYVVNSVLSFTGSYTYRDFNSGLTTKPSLDFTNNVISISANVRY